MRNLSPEASTVARRAGQGTALAAGLGLLALAAQAQPRGGTRGSTRGTIQEAEVEVVKDRVNTLPEATRNFEKIKLAPPPKPTRQLTYTYPDFRLPATRLAPVTQVLTIAPEELEPLTGNYLRLGGGNYGTLYGRAHLHSTRSEQYSYGLDVRHQSSASGPVDGRNSAVAQTSVAGTGEYYQGSTTFGLSLDYGRERYHFYGYDPALLPASGLPDADAIRQTFNRFALRASARNQAPDATVQYQVGVGYRYWGDDYTSAENNFLLDGKARYALNETSALTLQADASFITEKETFGDPAPVAYSRGRNFVQGTPAYEYRNANGLTLAVGATLGYSSEPGPGGGDLNRVSRGRVNPAVRVAYQVVPQKFQVYAGAGGAIQRVTRYDLTQENPWLGSGSSLSVADTHYGPTGYLGFTAAPTAGLELAARATYGRTRNLYFYNNDRLAALGTPRFRYPGSTYTLTYDTAAVDVLTLHAELAYPVAATWRAGLKADYNSYDVHGLAHPYGRPAFVGTAYATYNVFDKLLLGADFYVSTPNWGSRFTSGYNPGGGPFYQPTDAQTDAVIDLNLRAEYRITPKFSIFALGNNLANRHYQRFLGYPVKGINAVGGLAYSF